MRCCTRVGGRDVGNEAWAKALPHPHPARRIHKFLASMSYFVASISIHTYISCFIRQLISFCATTQQPARGHGLIQFIKASKSATDDRSHSFHHTSCRRARRRRRVPPLEAARLSPIAHHRPAAQYPLDGRTRQSPEEVVLKMTGAEAAHVRRHPFEIAAAQEVAPAIAPGATQGADQGAPRRPCLDRQRSEISLPSSTTCPDCAAAATS